MVKLGMVCVGDLNKLIVKQQMQDFVGVTEELHQTFLLFCFIFLFDCIL
jgi:hypothetical protein